MIFFPLFVALIIIILSFLLHKAKRNGKNNLPPGPLGFPFIGNLHQYDKYGKIFSLKLGSATIVVVSSANLAKEVLKIQDLIYCSRPSFLGLQKLSYYGQDIGVSPYNDYWRELRKICVMHLFSLKKVQCFSSIREDEVSRMIKKISQQATTSQVTNLSNIMISLTTSIICRVAFGITFDGETQERRKFDEVLKVTEEMLAGFFISDYFPLLGWLQLKKEQSTPIDLTLDNIKAIIMNLLIGGTDMSAATVWVMTASIANPNALKKVQAEIRESVGKTSLVNENDTSRLYPPAPLLIARETMRSSTLEGYEIKQKIIVHVNIWAIARNPEYWENPEKFIPERFLNSDIDFKGQNFEFIPFGAVKGQNFEFIPFGAGRRGCPGMALGVATVELMPCGMKKEDIDTDVLPGLTMHKKTPLCLVPRNYH
ncbi:unnamed protein product [Withania somnifera]